MANANRTVWIELARLTQNALLRRKYLSNYKRHLQREVKSHVNG